MKLPERIELMEERFARQDELVKAYVARCNRVIVGLLMLLVVLVFGVLLLVSRGGR